MPLYEVDYWNKQGAIRTKRIAARGEQYLPVVLKARDRWFEKIKRVQVLSSQPDPGDEENKTADAE